MRIPVPEPPAETQARVRELIPEFGASTNPVDLTPQMTADRYAECVRAVAEEPSIGGLLAINVGVDRAEFAEAFVAAREAKGKPVLAFLVDDPTVESRFASAGVPLFPTPERAVRAYGILLSRRRPAGRWEPAPAVPPPRGTPLDAVRARELLRKFGIPMCREKLVASVKQAVKVARSLGFPVAVKAAAAKSDARGVALNVSERTLALTAHRLIRRFRRVLVQEMVRGDHELLVGARRDPVFGPTVLFGSGGIWAEQTRDVAMRVCPVGPREARAMILETLAGRRLAGGRGVEPADVGRVASIIAAVSRLMVSRPSVLEIDLNPVIVRGARAVVVDALVVSAG